MRRATLAIPALMLLTTAVGAGQFDSTRAVEFVRLCRHTEEARPHLRNIYWALRLNRDCGAEFDAGPYANYVAKLQNRDGGFGFWAGDVSTPEATHAALAVLKHTDTPPRDAEACKAWLAAKLPEVSKDAKLHHDLHIEENVYHCLMALAAMDVVPSDLDEHLSLLRRGDGGWEIYLYFRAARAFGRDVGDRRAWIARVDELATYDCLHIRNAADRQGELEVMHMLGGTFSYGEWIRRNGARGGWQGPGEKLENQWRTRRAFKLLGVDPPPWMSNEVSQKLEIAPEPDGRFSAMPGLGSDPDLSVLVRKTLPDFARVATTQPGEQLQAILDKQAEEGYFQTAQPMQWWSDDEVLQHRLSVTSRLLTNMSLLGAKLARLDDATDWLEGVLVDHGEELSAGQIMRILECFETLGRQPKRREAIVPLVKRALGADAVLASRAMGILGEPPDPAAGEQAKRMLDSIRRADIPLEVSVLAGLLEVLDAGGAGYAHTDDFAARIAALQNPDGGVRRPYSPHSNLYDTLAAIRMARVLSRLQQRAVALE
jgi:hypothetical protein